jgi:hypothetical protein
MPEWIGRVLVIDGQAANRRIMEKQLTMQNLNIVPCQSGAEALTQRLAENDVVLTDARLPDMTGTALAAGLRDNGFTGPVLMLVTGSMHVADTDHNIARVLKKPLRRRELFGAISGLNKPGKAPVPIAVAPTAPARDHAPDLRQMRILAAEDNKTNRLVFSKLVKALDIDLTFATNGQEAIDAFEAQPPDLIFMDISMPEVDGKEATRQIRAIEAARGLAHTPIVALTAHAMTGDDQAILAAGLDHYLTKPLKKDAILGRIAEECPADCRTPMGGEADRTDAGLRMVSKV